MMIVYKITVFLAGMCVAVQVMAAFYRILDLWYTIRTEYLKIIRGIAFWSGVSMLLVILLGSDLRNAFLWGMTFYVPFYVINFLLLRSFLKYRWREMKKNG
ncbi:MAG: hypothetical protein D3924_05655 [Candidatus Electrothrix sp. AR4]|nr:hypothetical protein [Candidatus Electrothrix sp. AR4]